MEQHSNNNLTTSALFFKARLHVGFYAIFLQDWFQVFPREQFHIIKTEEYSLSVAEHIHQIYEFLDLREYSYVLLLSNCSRHKM